MERLTLLLFLLASLSSTRAVFVVLLDSSRCVHLRCEWHGEGKNCKSATLSHLLNQQKTVPGATPLNYTPRGDDEPESSILKRIQAKYPLNTFTVVNDYVAMGQQCKTRRLWCNDTGFFAAFTYEAYLKLFEDGLRVPPKFKC